MKFATGPGGGEIDWDVLKGQLSSFQIEKLTFFFTQFFDDDKNGIIDVSLTLSLPLDVVAG